MQRKNNLIAQSAILKIRLTRKRRRSGFGDAALFALFVPYGVSACSWCVFNPIWARERPYVVAHPLLLPLITGLPAAGREYLVEAPPGPLARSQRALRPELRRASPLAILSLWGIWGPKGLLPLNRGPGGILMRARISRS